MEKEHKNWNRIAINSNLIKKPSSFKIPDVDLKSPEILVHTNEPNIVGWVGSRLFSGIIIASAFGPWWIILLAMHAAAAVALAAVGSSAWLIMSLASLNCKRIVKINKFRSIYQKCLNKHSKRTQKREQSLPEVKIPMAKKATMKRTNVNFILTWIRLTNFSSLKIFFRE